jgi:hypothetical protein
VPVQEGTDRGPAAMPTELVLRRDALDRSQSANCNAEHTHPRACRQVFDGFDEPVAVSRPSARRVFPASADGILHLMRVQAVVRVRGAGCGHVAETVRRRSVEE